MLVSGPLAKPSSRFEVSGLELLVVLLDRGTDWPLTCSFRSTGSIRLNRCSSVFQLINSDQRQGGHVDPPSSSPYAHPFAVRPSLPPIFLLASASPLESHAHRVLLQEGVIDGEEVLSSSVAAGEGRIRGEACRETAGRGGAPSRGRGQAECAGKRRERQRRFVGSCQEAREERGWKPLLAGQGEEERKVVITNGGIG